MSAPPFARGLLAALLPQEHRAVVLTHLDEEFARMTEEHSPAAALWWYRRQVLGSLPGALTMRMRSMGLAPMASQFGQDARYAFRQMRRTPGFTAAAVLMLAVGLGLVAGTYTVVNGIFLRGWDVPDNGSVFRAWGTVAGAPEGGRIRDGFSFGAYKHFREQSKSADYVAYLFQNFRLGEERDGASTYLSGWFVSDNFLDVVKIPLQRGAGFATTTAAAGARVVITDGVWKRVLNADPSVVGRTVWMSGVPATVVGVTAPGFASLAERQIDLMVDLSSATPWKRNAAEVVANDTTCCVTLAGRRRPEWTMTQVREELALLTSQYRRSNAQAELTVSLRDTAPGVPNDRGAGLIFTLLGAAVTLVWCLTCANVGNLFLAKSLRRNREIAVRLALGASRGRLVRQLLAEGLVLAAVAGSAAYALTAGVPTVMAQIDGTAAMFEPDWMVAAVAAFATVVTCLLVALAPALQATRIAWNGAGTTATVRTGRMREVVLTVQIAVAAVLLLSATLVARGVFQAAAGADFALHSTTAVTFQLSPEAAAEKGRADAMRASLREAIDRGGRGLALVDQSPASEHAGSPTSVRPTGSPAEFSVQVLPMSAAAFEILEVPVVEGRLANDNPEAGEAVVNQTLARRVWPGESALGKSLALNFNRRTYSIVGVTRDAHLTELGAIEPLIHIPASRSSPSTSASVILARTTPGLLERVTAIGKAIDPSLTVTLTPLSESIQSTLQEARLGAAIAGGLGVVALVLAIVGVFGVFSYLIEERRREIGIRLALGATRRQIRLALARACRLPVMAGLAGGLALSIIAGALLRRFLFGLSPVDPLSYVIVTLVLLAAAIAATAGPVRRALRVDPAVTLRAD